jgi:hypothetical protein
MAAGGDIASAVETQWWIGSCVRWISCYESTYSQRKIRMEEIEQRVIVCV